MINKPIFQYIATPGAFSVCMQHLLPDHDIMTQKLPKPSFMPSYIFGGALLLGIYLTSFHSYLLFHSVAETFSILVSFSIFLFALNTLDFVEARYFFILGTAYLFVGGFDFLHMMTYRGMGVFSIEGANIATQTWIIARYLESLSLLALPFVIHRRINPVLILVLYSVLSVFLFLLMFIYRVFPEAYIEGSGLTAFKIFSEYLICAILAGAAAMLYRRRKDLHMVIYRLLMVAIGFTIAQELAFTLYTDVYGPANLLGHLFKIVSFYLVYRAVLAHGLLRPYRSMFRKLHASKAALEQYSRELESRVAERTRALEASNRQLKYLSQKLMTAEDDERRRIARDLHDSIGQSLSAIKVHVENSVNDIGGRLQADDRMRLKNLVPMIKTAITDVKRIIRNLRPSMLDELGIVATINWICREFNTVYPDIRIEKKLEVDDHHVPEMLKTPIFRLLQEALNNIGKHSGASRIEISLARRDGQIWLEIRDDGCGFDPQSAGQHTAQASGFGLAGMRERAEICGASFRIDSSPGEGTRIATKWPLDVAQAAN
jgi:signal transduction histidine kinase